MNTESELARAQVQTAAIVAADPSRRGDPTLPLAQYVARERLEEWRRRFEGGERTMLLTAIRTCAAHGLVMPEWIARAYIDAYDLISSARAGSWDDVFGSPHGKGKHLSRLRQTRETWPIVLAAVVEAVNDGEIQRGEPIPRSLFERIGAMKGVHLARTRVEELYEVGKAMTGIDPAAKLENLPAGKIAES